MEDEIDDSTHCQICFEPYEDTGDRLPRLLPRTHTLCHACVGELITRSTLVCPQDRQGHPAFQGARSFPQNKYILNHLKRQEEKGELFEVCRRHKKKMFFYCKDCKVVICPVCIQQKHQKHRIIDFFREKLDVVPLIEKLNGYRNELLATKEEIDEDCKDNIIRLRKNKEDLFKLLDDKIVYATRSIDALNDMKEKGDGEKTAKETLSNILMVEKIQTKMAEDLKSPLKITTYGITEIETSVFLSGDKEGLSSKLRRYCWKGVKIFLMFWIALISLEQMMVWMGIKAVHGFVQEMINRMIKLAFPSLCGYCDIGYWTIFGLIVMELTFVMRLIQRLNRWIWYKIHLQTRTKEVKRLLL